MEKKEIIPEINEQREKNGEAADLTLEEKQAVEDYIVSLITKEHIYGELTVGKGLRPNQKGELSLIFSSFETSLDAAVETIYEALQKNPGIERLKELAEEENLAGMNLYIKTEIREIAIKFYKDILEEKKRAKGLNARQQKDLELLESEIERHSTHVLEAASEVLSKAVEKKEWDKINSAVVDKLREIEDILKRLDGDSLQKRGLSMADIESELKRIKETEREKIVKNCLERFIADGLNEPGVINQRYFDFWINYYTDGAFEHSENKSLREAFQIAFERNAVPLSVPEKEPDQPVTLENILMSGDLQRAFEEIKEFITKKLIGQLKKRRSETDQEDDLKEDEKSTLATFFKNEYQDNFSAKGAPNSDEGRNIFTEELMHFVLQELKKK